MAYCIKPFTNGWRARSGVQGLTKSYSHDNDETFSPVVCFTANPNMFAIVAE